ncbi:MAG TPA: tyrosine-type recombinase/integrase [Anaerolineae bacterium]|nr:tyrosine-type recombinase/integrase [Anaerolineae bacterium]HPL29495.1 tyrosine-type recombinase/integrase [Anaerolineae bacterium]
MSAEHLTLHILKFSPLDAALQGFLLDRQAARCTPKTLEHYRYTVGGFVAWLKAQDVRDVAHIKAGHVRAYLVSIQERGVKDTTQHAHARGIKAWLNWLVREGDLSESPMARVAMPRLEQRVPPPFTPEEVHKLLTACDRKTATGARNYALILVLLDTGLRAAECVALRVGDVDMRTGLAVVLGKGRKQRQVRVGNKARAAILRLMAYRGEPSPRAALWPAYDLQGCECGALSVHGLQTALVRLGRAAGVSPCGPHRFRRTFALWCLRDGMDLHSLRLLMGHSSLTVLQRYLALTGEDVERAHAAHSPADKLL